MPHDPRVILKNTFGYEEFRAPQGEIIASVLDGHNTLALLPTGQGKSLCYQIPGLALSGLTIVISPLIALMKDQVDALHRRGIAAHYINSTLSRTEIQHKYQDIEKGVCQFVYVAPERLLTKTFLALMKAYPPTFVAVDEAHCFSTWGHDFRPHYRDIPQFLTELPHRPKLALFTATASRAVVEDLQRSFVIQPPHTFRGSFFRKNLFITTRHFTLQSQRFLYLVYLLRHVFPDQSGLIYVATRKQAEMLHQALTKLDFDHRPTLEYYHAGRSTEEKSVLQEKFINDDIKIMIATNAFGMGIDKSNIRFVIHFQTPGSLENYVQEIGRAGRDGQFSWCELLFHPTDIEVHQRMQSEKTAERNQRSLDTMIEFLMSRRCHHQKILSYFQDSYQFTHGCARCERCSPFSQIFLQRLSKHLGQSVEDQTFHPPTFVAQQCFILEQNDLIDPAKLLAVGQGMIQ